MNNYQKTYEEKVGKAELNIKEAIAGEKINCRLTYKTGVYGIDDSGSLKVLFRIASDFEEFQFSDPKADNFVKISASRKNFKVKIESRSNGALGKAYVRPWSRGFTLHFSDSFLEEGDELYIDFKNWRMQTFCEKKFGFKICVDSFSTGKYVEMKDYPQIEIIPDRASQLKIVAPTKIKVNSAFNALIKIEDKYGNPCYNQHGVFNLEENSNIQGISNKLKFKDGKALLKLKSQQKGLGIIRAKYKNIKGISNPIVFLESLKDNHYWADLHAQSGETVGTNDVVDYFNFARDYAFIDVASHQANDFQVTNEVWDRINKTTQSINKDGEFVAFPGYEWSGNTHLGGDRNVIYFNEKNPIFRSSHALVDDFKDLRNDAPTVKDLFTKLKSKKVIVFAHVGGRYADLNFHNEKIEKSVEIHSSWGTFEWFFHDALRKGYKIGVVANSDGHKGQPGASYPGVFHFGSFGGLTCILSSSLSRKSIFNSLLHRHCYATTGARIYLDIDCSINDKKVRVGDIVKVKNSPVLRISTCGTSPIDRVEVWRGDRVISSNFPEMDGGLIKVAYSGSKVRGRDRKMKWAGKIKLSNNHFDGKIEKVNFCNPNSFMKTNSNSIEWEGETSGGVQALIFDLKSEKGKLEMKVNDKIIKLSIAEIKQTPKKIKMGNLDAKLEIYRIPKKENLQIFDFEIKLDNLKKGSNPVFVKVIQRDGHMAWSSPIYFEK